MIRFARYIFVGEDKIIENDPHDTIIQTLISKNLIDDEQNPKGELKIYCDSIELIEPKVNIGHLDFTEIIDPFIDPNLPRHRCRVCEKIQPSEGTFIKHPLSGEAFRVEITNCISCGVVVDRNWKQTDDSYVFRTRFLVSLIAQNFVVALPTIGESVPVFLDVIAKACGVPVKEIFIAHKIDG